MSGCQLQCEPWMCSSSPSPIRPCASCHSGHSEGCWLILHAVVLSEHHRGFIIIIIINFFFLPSSVSAAGHLRMIFMDFVVSGRLYACSL